MKTGNRKTLALLLLGIWAAAAAQAPPGEEPAVAAEVAETEVQALPCVPADDRPQASDGETGPLDSEAEDAGQAIEPCEEEVFEDVEASVEEEFKPGDEISEDYPVPLPADM